jgi:ribosomal-protein-alanine N-acetyltransferase
VWCLTPFSDLNLLQQQQVFLIEQSCHLSPWSFETITGLNHEQYWSMAVLNESIHLVDKTVYAYIIGMPIVGTTDWELLNLSVTPVRQGQGIGTGLLQFTFNKLVYEGVKRVLLEVRESNRVAIHLYQRVGFFQIGVRKQYYITSNKTRENAWVMACDLSNHTYDEQLTSKSLAQAGGNLA